MNVETKKVTMMFIKVWLGIWTAWLLIMYLGYKYLLTILP